MIESGDPEPLCAAVAFMQRGRQTVIYRYPTLGRLQQVQVAVLYATRECGPGYTSGGAAPEGRKSERTERSRLITKKKMP